MEQRDYLKRQIDELGQVLTRIVAGLLQLKDGITFSQGVESASQQLKDALDYNLDELLSIPDEEFISILKAKKIKNESFDKLAELLLLIADSEGPTEKGKKLYKKSLLLLDKLESVETIYSMDRHRKIERIRKIVS